MPPDDALDLDTRQAVLDAAAELIAEGGTAALTTRAVAAKAAIQPPTLYRIFGDKRGLLDAVAQHSFTQFVAQKESAEPHPDPVEDLRRGWDRYVAFAVENPDVFAIMNAIGSPLARSPAALSGIAVLERRVARLAEAGRLLVPEARAVALIHAAGVGVVSTLLARAPAERDVALSETALEAVLAAIADVGVAEPRTQLTSLAVGLRAHLDEAPMLSGGERILMREWLDRIAGGSGPGASPRDRTVP